MAYFLGRDVNLAISTEQEAFGLKVTDQVLDITGTSTSDASDSDQIPPRVVGLTTAGDTEEAEVMTITPSSVTLQQYESLAADGNHYISLTDMDGDLHVISFNDSDAGSYVAPTTGELSGLTQATSTVVEIDSTGIADDNTCDTNGALGSGDTFGSNPKIIKCDSTANLYEGMGVSGTGIAVSSVITQIDSATLFRVNNDTTGSLNENVTDIAFDTDTAAAVAGAIRKAINGSNIHNTKATSGVGQIVVATTGQGTSAVVTLTARQAGSITGILRGSGDSDWQSAIAVATSNQGVTGDNKVSDITSLEIGTGTMDEDITYMGQRTGLKAEIKNETSITITKKKGKTGTANSIFYYLFNEARCGIRHTAGTIDADVGTTDASLALDNNQNMPQATTDGTNFGYRVFIQLKSGAEIMTIPNCCITDYSVSLNSDGITEEVLTLYSNVRPTVAATSTTTISAKADF